VYKTLEARGGVVVDFWPDFFDPGRIIWSPQNLVEDQKLIKDFGCRPYYSGARIICPYFGWMIRPLKAETTIF
jgi:hypothetical protein